MDQDMLQDKAETILAAADTVCDHCFGRQFARCGYGIENYERGRIIRHALENNEDINFDGDIPGEEYVNPENCTICNGLFNQVEHFAGRVLNSLNRYEFSTFLVGTRPPAEVVHNEEQLWEDAGVEWVEPLKSEMNRLIGKIVEEETDAEADFDRADILTIVDVEKDAVEVQINSLCVFGRYNKYERGLPQTEWTCRDCQGKGCHHCDFEGKLYETSVEELIAEPLLEAADGTSTKFHGAGREDRDARCLGKRPFVLEIMEPEVRSLDLDQLQENVNEAAADRVEVFTLRFVDPGMVQTVKQLRAPKTYKAIVELSTPVDELDLSTIQELQGEIRQDTPTRVEHRRADKTRTRTVHNIAAEKTGAYEITVTVKTDAGLYVKELISSDNERTTPSLAGVLGCEAECTQLDVVDVHDTEGEKSLNGNNP